MIDEDLSQEGKKNKDREAVDDKAHEKLGAFISITTAEQDVHKACKDSLQRKFIKNTDPNSRVYPETYSKAINVLNNTENDKRPSQLIWQHS